MRPLFCLPPILALAGCVNTATQSEILDRARAEVAWRENWGDSAYIRVRKEPGQYGLLWRVSAGSFDFSEYPDYEGPFVVPGTEREIQFTRQGCLISYTHCNTCCSPAPYAPVSPPVPVDDYPAK